MELSQSFYEFCKEQLFAGGLEELRGYAAAGLVGEGSECFGYDDDISQDHDFGPDFCIWIPERIYQENGGRLEAAYDALPETYRGYQRSSSRQTLIRNGAVFEDPYGEFTRRREYLLAYYPEDVIRKKLAAKTVAMAQAGQYNYVRCCRRGEWESAYLAGGEFVRAALSVIYLLNKKYMPFYKWAFRGVETLTELRNAAVDLKAFVRLEDSSKNAVQKRILIESICDEIVCELRKKGYSTSNGDFLEPHGNSIMSGIQDDWLRSLHVMADYG